MAATKIQPVDLDQVVNEEGADARVPLFKLDGEEFTIPAQPKATIALRYLYDVRVKGEDIAASRLLESLLGEEGFQALMNHESLTFTQLQQVMAVAQQVVLGAVEEAQGNG